MPHKITTAERKHLDYLRQRGLRTSLGYERALKGLRAKEVKRVLRLCADSFALESWPAIIQANISEDYFKPWEVSLFRAVGVPMAKTTSRDLSQAKAAEDDIFWEDALTAYAKNRAGSAIVSVNGTLKESLLDILRKQMEDDPTASIEALTKRVFRDFQVMDKWMVRRIAQTESMIGMAQAADYAAQTLDAKYTKIWAISGLGNTRDTHYVMDNVEVDQNEPFTLEGGQVMFPHDTSLGAAAAEIINCACACLRVPKSASLRPTPRPAMPAPAPLPMPKPIITPTPAPKPQAATPKPSPVPANPKPAAATLTEAQRITQMTADLPDSIPEETRKAIAENNIALEKKLNTTKGMPMSVDEADKSHANPKFLDTYSYKVNCQTCSPAYVLRTRGFDVTAGPNTRREGNLSAYLSDSRNFWKKWLNADGTQAEHIKFKEWIAQKGKRYFSPEDYLEFYDAHTKEEGIYEVALSWESRGGHSTLLQRFADGTLKRIDAQNGMQWVLDVNNQICSRAKSFVYDTCDGIMRVDDKIFNPEYANIFKKVKK